MTSLKPSQLISYLNQLVSSSLPISTMIWGPPGIGKSSIVAQVAQEAGLEFIDLRLSLLASADLRGLPVPVPPGEDEETGTSTWYPPEFLPRQGKGILFLDELNMAPPAMQGVAQQLILDRRVGSYVVPDGWFLVAAGNLRDDGGSGYGVRGRVAGGPGKACRVPCLAVRPQARDGPRAGRKLPVSFLGNARASATALSPGQP